MFAWLDEIRGRMAECAEDRGHVLERQLGYGFDGIVYSTTCQSAIKGLRYAQLYERERDVYLRLFNAGVFEVGGCSIPRLIDYEDRLWVVEINRPAAVRPRFRWCVP